MTLREKQADFVVMVSKLVCFAFVTGIKVFVLEWYRDAERQKELIKSGASQIKNASQGKHVRGLAVDICIMEGRTVTWDFNKYVPLGEYWEKIGGVWGGRWKTIRDGVHFEYKEE